MIKTDIITAAADIAGAINRDIANRPNFTLTHAQLMTRIDNYCDDPSITSADRCRIYSLLANDPAMPFRD